LQAVVQRVILTEELCKAHLALSLNIPPRCWECLEKGVRSTRLKSRAKEKA